MKNPLHSKSAISLFEVIIAVFIISITSVAILTLLTSALQGTRISRDKMIAINLAREGVEAVRNIRDTNWLLFSADKENCWNAQDYSGPPCTGIVGGHYTAELRIDYKWYLGGPFAELDLKDAGGVDNEDEEYQMHLKDGRYDHNSTSPSEPTRFYREIHITDVTPDTMKVTSKVQWMDGNQVQDVEFITELTNYQE